MSNRTLCIFIGRFQPLHVGHMHVIKTALGELHSSLLILCGMPAQDQIKEPEIQEKYDRNFLPYEVRVEILKASVAQLYPEIKIISSKSAIRNPSDCISLDSSFNSSLNPDASSQICIIEPLYDLPSDETWVEQVNVIVNRILQQYLPEINRHDIYLIGCDKDDSSYYLKLFPEYNLYLTQHFEKINATDIRLGMKQISSVEEFIEKSALLPKPSKEILKRFIREREM